MIAILQWLGIASTAEVQALKKRVEALEGQQPQRYPGPPWRLICDAPGCGAVYTPGVDPPDKGWVRHDVGVVLCGKCRGMPRPQVKDIAFAKRSVADAGPPVVPGAGGGLPGAVVKDAPSGGRADAGGITGVIHPIDAGVDNDRLSQQGQGVIEADALLPSTEGLGRSGHSMGGVIG